MARHVTATCPCTRCEYERECYEYHSDAA